MSVKDKTWCPVSEAARILGVSPKTVIRRIKRGELQGRKEGNRWVVNLSDIAGQVSGQMSDMIGTDVGQLSRGDIAALKERVARLEEENRLLRERVQELQEERLFLRDRILALEGTISALQETLKTLSQKALPPTGESLGQKLKRLFKRKRGKPAPSKS